MEGAFFPWIPKWGVGVFNHWDSKWGGRFWIRTKGRDPKWGGDVLTLFFMTQNLKFAGPTAQRRVRASELRS